MNWLGYAIVAPILWGMMSHFDKYLISRYYQSKSVGALIIYSGLIGIPVAVVIAFFNANVFNLSPVSILINILSGAVYICTMIAYLQALDTDDASTVAPLFQLSTIFSTILGFIIFGEVLTLNQIVGGTVILIGSFGISLGMIESEGSKLYFKKQMFGLMLLASFLSSTTGILFKYAAVETSFWDSVFWVYMGYSIYTIIILLIAPKVRNEFFEDVRVNSIPAIFLNFINELLTAIGNLSFSFALMLAPVGLVFFVSEGLQPFFVLLYGIILTKIFPSITNENISRNHLIQKILAICLMAAGVYLIGI